MANDPDAPGEPGTADLVQRARLGDRAAFGALYARFARVVHGLLLAHGAGAEADDLTQDVFMLAFERLPGLREPAAFPGWLCAAARRRALDHARAVRRRPAPTDPPEPAGAERPPAETASLRDGAARALACIAALPVAYRETLVLRLVEGLSGPEIADRTGLTHGSVRVNLTRGMALLRPLLQEAGLP